MSIVEIETLPIEQNDIFLKCMMQDSMEVMFDYMQDEQNRGHCFRFIRNSYVIPR